MLASVSAEVQVAFVSFHVLQLLSFDVQFLHLHELQLQDLEQILVLYGRKNIKILKFTIKKSMSDSKHANMFLNVSDFQFNLVHYWVQFLPAGLNGPCKYDYPPPKAFSSFFGAFAEIWRQNDKLSYPKAKGIRLIFVCICGNLNATLLNDALEICLIFGRF